MRSLCLLVVFESAFRDVTDFCLGVIFLSVLVFTVVRLLYLCGGAFCDPSIPFSLRKVIFNRWSVERVLPANAPSLDGGRISWESDLPQYCSRYSNSALQK